MAKKASPRPGKIYVRFDPVQRIQHIFFLISFTLLGLTGLPQKYPLAPVSIAFFELLGGVENARLIHHASAIVMMIVSVFHVLELIYRVLVLRTPISMIPWIDDIKHVLHDIRYYFGYEKHKAYYGRYSYAEKAEYLALIWGTIIMGLTGFMMWNPISAVRFLPGEIVPASKAAHGGEAILAVLAIILWHFYHVHIKTFNLSMFNGTMTREEMEHEHPAELALIESGEEHPPMPEHILRRRQMYYAPLAIGILAVFSYGFYLFVGYETTAVVNPPVGETAPVFVPYTPTPIPPTSTPAPTRTPEPTPAVTEGISATIDPSISRTTWDGEIGALFKERCVLCHGNDPKGGLNLSSYAEAIKGGNSGMAFSPGDSTNSLVVTKFESGDHSFAEIPPKMLEQIKTWIDDGIPEK